MKMKKMLTIMSLGLMVWQVEVSGAVPMGRAFVYQGRLIDANDVADGLYDFQFKLFDDPCMGNQQGSTIDINDLDIINGYFTVELDFGSDVFNGDARWLETTVAQSDGSDPDPCTLRPRIEITPVPYALQTRGIFVDNVLNVGIGTTSPVGKLHVDGGKAMDGTWGANVVIKAQDGGDGWEMQNNGEAGGDIILLPGEGGEEIGVGFPGPDGSVGIGTMSPEAKLDISGDVKVTGSVESTDAVIMATNTGSGDGVQGESWGSSGRGVEGLALYSGPGENYGGYFVAEGVNGRGVYAEASKTGDVENYGGYFVAEGVNGRAVYGEASNNGDAVNYGGYFTATGDHGCGVYGKSLDGIAVYGYSNSSIGVYGDSASSYAGYFHGDVEVRGSLDVYGTLMKMAGSFKIDHPLDPENKYLQHSFVESPDMMNVYNGNVTLDENGEAVVTLPAYFEALNRDFRYQLTCIGGFAPVYVAEEITENQFKIGGGKRGMKVSWQVTGVRKDAYAKANPIVVEEDKSVEERGYYLNPAAYGLPEEKGIEAVHNARFSETRQVAKSVD